MRITRVYTRQGDDGETRLGGSQLVSKAALRIRAYGTVDELNSTIGLAMAFELDAAIQTVLTDIQHQLFTVGGDLCVLEEDKKSFKMKGIADEQVQFLERNIDNFNAKLSALEDFILPGGTRGSAFLHQARCVCRRAETLVVELSKEEEIGKQVLPYLNRLSDALFVFARFENYQKGRPDILWNKDR